MKTFFALYDKDDNFINCGFSLAEIGVKKTRSWFWQHTVKKVKLYKIPLAPQNDIFKETDELFIKEFADENFTAKEQAKIAGCTERTIFRRKAKLRGM